MKVFIISTSSIPYVSRRTINSIIRLTSVGNSVIYCVSKYHIVSHTNHIRFWTDYNSSQGGTQHQSAEVPNLSSTHVVLTVSVDELHIRYPSSQTT
ncbi:hypothetical protein LSH36_151g05022 [Paralvinella palmiformis]|uniref:Uncharacterized protein n=1 Tax=Paralvinella palmiformis TaxID=53620 RepID=A0AAD9JWD5_9ANNE|nr:hypothetical protein LSH36_151g05022 [Paralvinella palmiformis]